MRVLLISLLNQNTIINLVKICSHSSENKMRVCAKSRIKLPPIITLIAFGMFYLSSVSAQEQSDLDNDDVVGIEKIQVTSQKRSQSIQDVGVSIAAITGEQMQKQALANSVDLLQGVTNLDIAMPAGSTNANIFVRGIGTKGVGFNVQSGVGIYADEVALNSPVVNILQLFDLERVEVLRGPQNTLYGRNTTGGAINYISKKPEIGSDTSGYVNTTIGRFGEVNLDGAIGASLSDTLAMRLSVQSQKRDGFRTNLFNGKKTVERDKLAVRGQILFEPTSESSVLIKAHAEKVDDENVRRKNAGPFDPTVSSEECSTPFVIGACADGNGFVDSADWLEINQDMLRAANKVDSYGLSSTINIDFNEFTLTSITAHESNEQTLSEDNDASPAHDFHFFIDSSAEQVSQEIRLTSDSGSDLRWILGAYGFWETKSGTTGPTFSTPMGIMLTLSNAEFDYRSYSAFGEVEYDLSEKTTIIAGGRLGSDNVKGSTTAIFAFASQLGDLDITTPSMSGSPLPNFDALLAAAEANGARVLRVGGDTDPEAKINDTTWNEWGGKLAINHKASPDTLYYGSWGRGYKAGVFPNAPMAIALGQGDTPFNPEIVNTYEVGAKTEFAEGKIRLNGSLFATNYEDQQVSQFVNGEFSVISVDSEIKGVEMDLNWQATEDLRIDAGLALLDTNITDSIDVTQVGNNLVGSPDVTGRIAVSKYWDLADGSMLNLSVDLRYTGNRYYDLTNFYEEESYAVLNAQAYYEFGNMLQYRLGVWIKNITNEEYFLGRDASTTYHSLVVSEPRTFGLNFNYQF